MITRPTCLLLGNAPQPFCLKVEISKWQLGGFEMSLAGGTGARHLGRWAATEKPTHRIHASLDSPMDAAYGLSLSPRISML